MEGMDLSTTITILQTDAISVSRILTHHPLSCIQMDNVSGNNA